MDKQKFISKIYNKNNDRLMKVIDYDKVVKAGVSKIYTKKQLEELMRWKIMPKRSEDIFYGGKNDR